MPFFVGDNCVNCKHTDCVAVCPVDCFYEGPNFLVIHQDECIDCALCVSECPIDAIFDSSECPPGQEEMLALNAELAKCLPGITETRPPMDGFEQWENVPNKTVLAQKQ